MINHTEQYASMTGLNFLLWNWVWIEWNLHYFGVRYQYGLNSVLHPINFEKKLWEIKEVLFVYLGSNEVSKVFEEWKACLLDNIFLEARKYLNRSIFHIIRRVHYNFWQNCISLVLHLLSWIHLEYLWIRLLPWIQFLLSIKVWYKNLLYFLLFKQWTTRNLMPFWLFVHFYGI